MEFIKMLKERRSVRNFQDKEVAREIIEDIVDAARLAPSAVNIQPWEFIIITDTAMKKKIADITDYGKFIAEAPVCIVVCCKSTKYYLEDGSAATQNVLLAAKAYGLGSCWVAGDKKAYAETVKGILGIPKDYKLISLIPMGYPASEPSIPRKRPLKEVIHWERF